MTWPRYLPPSRILCTGARVLAAALTLSLVRKNDNMMMARIEHDHAPGSAFPGVPIFGFANAGAALAGIGLAGIFVSAQA